MTTQPHASRQDWRKALEFARRAPRCHARCKHSKRPCKAPAVTGGKVCRMHGAKSGAPQGERNGAYKHGRHTIEAREQSRRFRQEMRDFRALMRQLESDE